MAERKNTVELITRKRSVFGRPGFLVVTGLLTLFTVPLLLFVPHAGARHRDGLRYEEGQMVVTVRAQSERVHVLKFPSRKAWLSAQKDPNSKSPDS